jgi:hypothetical protein
LPVPSITSRVAQSKAARCGLQALNADAQTPYPWLEHLTLARTFLASVALPLGPFGRYSPAAQKLDLGQKGGKSMARINGAICAIALGWTGLAGCSSFDITSMVALKSDSLGKERVVSGSIEAVAQSTQSTLSQMGFAANMTRKGETIRISSKTAAGATFTMVLTDAKTGAGEQTRIRIEWDGGSDDNLGLQLLAQLPAIVQK